MYEISDYVKSIKRNTMKDLGYCENVFHFYMNKRYYITTKYSFTSMKAGRGMRWLSRRITRDLEYYIKEESVREPVLFKIDTGEPNLICTDSFRLSLFCMVANKAKSSIQSVDDMFD